MATDLARVSMTVATMLAGDGEVEVGGGRRRKGGREMGCHGDCTSTLRSRRRRRQRDYHRDGDGGVRTQLRKKEEIIGATIGRRKKEKGTGEAARGMKGF